jgi:hypothetical protein
MNAAKNKQFKFENPDISGVVQSLGAPNFINNDQRPRFTFALLVNGEHVVLAVDLTRPGSSAVVPIVCAAFQTGVRIDIGLLPGIVHEVDWAQVPKPRVKPAE